MYQRRGSSRKWLHVNASAGATGSACGRNEAALDSFGKDYLDWTNRIGRFFELFHHVASMASGVMALVPHNGAVVTFLGIAGLARRQSYRDIFAITCLKTGPSLLSVCGASSISSSQPRTHRLILVERHEC